MKKATKRKLLQIGAILGLLAVIFIPTTSSFAAENYYQYYFSIKANQGNTRSEGLYRSSTTTSIPWAVDMYSSDESSGKDVTRFWIEGQDGANVSASVDVLEDAGRYYKNPYSSANQRTVYLTAENNNYNSNTFFCTGYWDEEI